MTNSFRKFYRGYLYRDTKLEVWQKVGITMLIAVIAGVVGWGYEFLVALLETHEVYMQGGNLLPWINIYAIGAVLLVPATYRLRRYPWAVLVVAMVITGVVELVGGWLVYTIGDGTRYWNYDHGVWLIGNINGFVCLMSVVCFGIGALILIYGVLPGLIEMARRMSKRGFLTLAIILFSLIMVDEMTNLTLKNLGQPTAMDFYRAMGMKYQEF